MAYDRYDTRRSSIRSPRDPRAAGYDREDRGFFERARDEVTSWFGDERAEHRRDIDQRDDDRFENSRFYGPDRNYGRDDRGPRYRDERYQRPYTGMNEQRYGYSDDDGPPRSWQNDRWDRGTSPSQPRGLYDRDYSNWRGRQIDDLDRDYDEFRRENSARFESEFTQWRGQRQAKRQLLGTVTEHMDVVGSDLEPIGKVDFVKNDKVILTKSDSPDGRHHTIGIARIDRVEEDKLVLDMTAEDVKQRFQQQKSSAMFDREEADGPHILDRSFSGTY